MMDIDTLIEKGLESEERLIHEFITGVQWLRLYRMVMRGEPLAVNKLDRLGIPIDGFIDAFETLQNTGMTRESAFIEAAVQQFEKRLKST
jgi:hypothetical protein